jgi:hypothetical protein
MNDQEEDLKHVMSSLDKMNPKTLEEMFNEYMSKYMSKHLVDEIFNQNPLLSRLLERKRASYSSDSPLRYPLYYDKSNTES